MYRNCQIGFSYSLPPSWQRVTIGNTPPVSEQNPQQPNSKKGVAQTAACAKTVFSARHGNPASAISIVVLPFSCYGQPMTPKNLPDFAAGVSQGLRQNLNIFEPVYGNYTLGSHAFWIERAVGIPRDHPEVRYTIEIACSILKSSAVCWMTAASGAGGLRAFENSSVSLDGEPSIALVPENAFGKDPF